MTDVEYALDGFEQIEVSWPAEVDEGVVKASLAAQNMGEDARLNEQQYRACRALLGGKNLVISGKAGTGKSTTLQVLKALADSAGKRVAVAAPSGAAAQLVGGRTIHNTFRFSTRVTPGALADKAEPARPLPLDLLIIDEISMVKADLFDCLDIELRRLKKEPALPMGGVQLVLLGDSLQLPPVHPNSDFRDDKAKQAQDKQFYEDFFRSYNRVYFDSAKVWPKLVPTLERVDLQRVERVSGDDELVTAFNEVRQGLVTQGSWVLLDSLVADMDVDTAVGQGWMALAADNKTVDRVNDRALADLGTPIVNLPWEIEGDVNASHERDAPFVDRLRLAVGAKVMMTVNHADGLFFNGTFGTIRAVSPRQLTVELASVDGDSATRVIQVSRHSFEVTEMRLVEEEVEEVAPPELTMIDDPVSRPAPPPAPKKRWREVEIGKITQFPVRLAWAITVHRAQGKTLERCYLQNPLTMDGAGQLYVALSRVKSREGLLLSEPIDRRRYRPPVERVRQERLQERRAALAAGQVVESGAPVTGTAFIGVSGCGLGEDSVVFTLAVMIAREGRWVCDMTTLVSPEVHFSHHARLDGRKLRPYELALAPTLGQVWSQLAPLLQGCQVICVDGWMLEYALQSVGISAGLALGVAVDAGDADAVASTVGLPDMDVGVIGVPIRQRVAEVVEKYLQGDLDVTGGLPVDPAATDEVLASIKAQSGELPEMVGLWQGPEMAAVSPGNLVDGVLAHERDLSERAAALVARARERTSWNRVVRAMAVAELSRRSTDPAAVAAVEAALPLADEVDFETIFGAAAKPAVGLFPYWAPPVAPALERLGLRMVRAPEVTKRDCVAVIMEDTSLLSSRAMTWRKRGLPLVDRGEFLCWTRG